MGGFPAASSSSLFSSPGSKLPINLTLHFSSILFTRHKLPTPQPYVTQKASPTKEKMSSRRTLQNWDAETHEAVLLAMIEFMKPTASNWTAIVGSLRSKGYTFSEGALMYVFPRPFFRRQRVAAFWIFPLEIFSAPSLPTLLLPKTTLLAALLCTFTFTFIYTAFNCALGHWRIAFLPSSTCPSNLPTGITRHILCCSKL